jgi:hypothetical protein
MHDLGMILVKKREARKLFMMNWMKISDILLEDGII